MQEMIDRGEGAIERTRSVHVAVSAVMSNAGEATRALSLARALRGTCPVGVRLTVSFLSQGGRFDAAAAEAGFAMVPCRPQFRGENAMQDLQRDLPELVGSEQIARDLIEGQLAALRALGPDAVLHGFWPFAGIAARLLGLPNIAFLPLPLVRSCIAGGMFPDLPDEAGPAARLPRPVRHRLAKAGSTLMTRAPFFHQRRLGAAAATCGWPTSGPLPLWEANRAALTVINDLPAFHTGYPLPENVVVTGPVFPGCETLREDGDQEAEPDPQIAAALHRDGRPAVLVAMGSSGSRQALLEAARAVAPTDRDRWNVVILVPPAVCGTDEVHAAAGGGPHVLVTDRFVPALAVTRLADVVVGHGGQGTVQTTMAAGTPMIGIGTVLEQQVNLEHVRQAGAGLRVQQHRWRAPVVRRAIRTVLADPAYRRHAQELAASIRTQDGPGTAAERMWEYLLGHPSPVPVPVPGA
ncbi:MAG: hypothetical protein QG671_2079 [Actinomycetota bacterium]|nr:hypothetical protein [Actinomycetota bacterium]